MVFILGLIKRIVNVPLFHFLKKIGSIGVNSSWNVSIILQWNHLCLDISFFWVIKLWILFYNTLSYSDYLFVLSCGSMFWDIEAIYLSCRIYECAGVYSVFLLFWYLYGLSFFIKFLILVICVFFLCWRFVSIIGFSRESDLWLIFYWFSVFNFNISVLIFIICLLAFVLFGHLFLFWFRCLDDIIDFYCFLI